ncbi:ras-related and estrogen-regulated growth inhibitor isoform X1 [Phyllopteryx taeniolatus]|uniref:ras-related and estrogen-regulated growth inhibitor isoform X1 n=2 Tax=Phyllopteryx taeniolatus TaxID=161469 RepID=UPI002AD1F534|nr:ras-related and estrogen-regulated growth inhibitor isoform X1 [Phyllopteryx taeniolatus]
MTARRGTKSRNEKNNKRRRFLPRGRGDGHLISELAVMAKSPEVKLAVLGRAGVGKSALVVRFLTRRFIWEYDPTLESTYRHQANIDDEVVAMEILDTAGQEDNQQREGHVRWGDGFVVVYDITDRGSFEDVAPLRSLLEEVKKPKNVPLVLVGNKRDLDHVRQVSTEEGERLAAEMACAFYECSACADEGGAVAEVFHELCREVRRRKAVQGKARRRSSTTHVKQAINKMLTKISS